MVATLKLRCSRLVEPGPSRIPVREFPEIPENPAVLKFPAGIPENIRLSVFLNFSKV